MAQSKVMDKPVVVNITWVDKVEGDFSFTDDWSYPMGVYKNQHGQVSCDGLCPPEIDKMKDSTGRIYDKYLKKFYKIIDTTHYYHSIKCEAHTYEFAGTDFITVWRAKGDTVKASTSCHVSTHASLDFKIIGSECIAVIDLNSITNSGSAVFPCLGGYLKIERKS